jgi:uncharacterized RDD family membrane protein YckC
MDRAAGARGYAGLVTRASALLLDALAINIIAAILGAAIGLIASLAGASTLKLAAVLSGGVLWLVWTGLYFVVFWTVTGQTPGGRLLGIRVVPAGEGRLGIVRAAGRFVVMMLALVPLGAGFLTVLFDERRRGPHDMIADTVVRWAGKVPGGSGELGDSADEQQHAEHGAHPGHQGALVGDP